jgi:hypothetical protein
VDNIVDERMLGDARNTVFGPGCATFRSGQRLDHLELSVGTQHRKQLTLYDFRAFNSVIGECSGALCPQVNHQTQEAPGDACLAELINLISASQQP